MTCQDNDFTTAYAIDLIASIAALKAPQDSLAGSPALLDLRALAQDAFMVHRPDGIAQCSAAMSDVQSLC